MSTERQGRARRPFEEQGSEAEVPTEAQVLSAEVLSCALRQVRVTYRDYNASLFGGKLRVPSFEWNQSETEWGAWVRGARVLRLSQQLIHGSWGQLTEILKHEMAHQYVDEVLGARDAEGPHGATFRRVCIERGIDSSATGAPRNPGDLEEPEQHSTLRRIEHLLALAQSDNQHEAEAAMSKARQLMLKYNLEEAALGRVSSYTFRHLGKPTGRRMAWQRRLANIMSEFFFVDVIMVPVYRPLEKKRGSVIEAIGTRANLEIAEYAHDFLERTALQLWRTHKQKERSKSDREKQSFLYGVMAGFSDKLERDAKKSQQEGLIWLGDPELGRYFRARHPHIRHVSGRGNVKGEAYSAGHSAGGRIVLHRGVDGGSTRGAPRLLGAPK
jgi:hypothetical protein